MNSLVCLHDANEIAAFFRGNPLRHLYEIGDLDPFFWPHTVWFGWRCDGVLRQVALLYTELDVPVLLANEHGLQAEPAASMAAMLPRLAALLPTQVYSHLDTHSANVLAEYYTLESHGTHMKMGLMDVAAIDAADTSETVALGAGDEAEVCAFYADAYPGNWFVPRMLQTSGFYGVRRAGRLVGAAGIHVLSRAYGVAALGNIATHPNWRGRGIAAAVSARLCQELRREGITQIGLNVKQSNTAAVTCYERLGFRPVMEYHEYMLTRR